MTEKTKRYRISPTYKRHFEEIEWYQKGDDIMERHTTWRDGSLFIEVPESDNGFDPDIIAKNDDNEWENYEWKLEETFDGSVEWEEHSKFFDEEELYEMEEEDVNEELEKRGWKQVKFFTVLHGELSVEPIEGDD